jgi:NifU-like protein involved in Fe-S cluster formation
VVVDPGGEAGPGLYQEAIVAAARRACGSGRLDTPDASVEVDNPLCGDRVGMDVQVGDGRLRGIAHRVRGCLLCEAAASIIAANAVGEPVEALTRVQDSLAHALANGFADASLPWPELAVFAPVVRHRSRHRCVTLAFEALARALAAAAPGAADDG